MDNVPRMRVSLYNGQKIIIVQTKVTFNCAGDAIFYDYNTNEKVCVSTGNIDSIVVATTY
jgi:hypothetical protein